MIPRAIAIATLVCGCGGAHMTPSDQAMVAAELGEQVNCVELYKPDAGAVDTCRARVKERFNSYWRAALDGGPK